MKILKWIGMFFLLWFAGTVISLVCEVGLYLLGGTLGDHGMGFVIILVITIGLIMYGTKTKKQIGGN